MSSDHHQLDHHHQDQLDPTGLLSLGVRTLDPTRAVRFGGQQLAATTYHSAQLLIRPTAREDDIKDALVRAAADQHLDVAFHPVDESLRALAADAGIGDDEDQPLIIRVLLVPRYGKDPVAPPDAWPVLQAYRSRWPLGSPERRAVQLNHVMNSHSDGLGATPYTRIPGTATPYTRIPGTATPYTRIPGSGTPYTRIPGSDPYVKSPNTVAPAPELAEYGMPGYGGRMPVSWIGPMPRRNPDSAFVQHRRPVVAILDTGVGDHPWLSDGRDGTEPIVDRDPRCGPLRIGLSDPDTAPDDPRVRLNDLVGGLDSTAGHGTFIAGLIRQCCPDADLLSVRVIAGDGVVVEADLLEALNMLWLRQQLAIRQDRPEDLVDIVSLSLGYYHEELGDAEFDPFLLAPLRALARLGVIIVASAGNDATVRPMYPAAFGPWAGGPIKSLLHAETPVLAVGATNPDGTVALFSNEGPWVSAYRQGAALISTMPAFDGSRTPSSEIERQGGYVRSTIDTDDFRSGFGMWSGTSFASPILAGELAERLRRNGSLHRRGSVADALDRAWVAVSSCLPQLQRPDAPAESETSCDHAVSHQTDSHQTDDESVEVPA